MHVPFCRHRCGYCNFTLVAGRDDLIGDYLLAIDKELETLESPREIDTLFLGGGTPTHLSTKELERLFTSIGTWLPLRANGEFSIEANPADLTREKVELFALAGGTRISIGAQSFDDGKLRFLERDHHARDIERAVRLANDAKLDVSLDLIFAVPHEVTGTWLLDLETAIQLDVGHLSTYSLTFERGARFWSKMYHHQLQPLDDEQEARLYEMAIEELTRAGFEHYEISNFARAGRTCQHNLNYWDGRTYFAFGPGAASHLDGTRRVNHRSTTAYLRRVLAGKSPVAEMERLSPAESARERLVFGLRKLAGIAADQFQKETEFSIRELAGEVIDQLVGADLVETDGTMIRVTRRGMMMCDSVAQMILQSAEA